MVDQLTSAADFVDVILTPGKLDVFENVKRIVDSLRQGNPDIRIFVQLVTTAERNKKVMTAEQVAAYALAIEDLVDAVRIYGASSELLSQIIEQLRAPQVEESH